METKKITLTSNLNCIALIETHRIKHLTKIDDSYKMEPIHIVNMPYIPLIIHTYADINKELEKIKYNFTYELLISHVTIPSTYIEEYVLSNNQEASKNQVTYNLLPNNTIESPIIYDNKNIVTISKLKNQEILADYILHNKRKLFNLKHIVDESFELFEEKNQKTYRL